jgi:P27 family predicted phage terminase small subunit
MIEETLEMKANSKADLRVLSGRSPGRDSGGRPLVERPKPKSSVPKAPAHLDKDAKKEWKRIVPELEALGLLTGVDMAALAGYCVAFGRWAHAEEELKKHGLTAVTPNGHVQKSVYLQVADKAMDQLRKFIQEFGLSPKGRGRVTATPKDEGDDFFAVRK